MGTLSVALDLALFFPAELAVSTGIIDGPLV
jgi:hypothetical protein